MDSVISIPGNSVAPYLFEYTKIEKTHDGEIVYVFRVNPIAQVDYIIAKIYLVIEAYDVEKGKVDTLSTYLFSRVK